MTASSKLSAVCYSGREGSTSWEGRTVSDPERFKGFVHDAVRRRVADEEQPFEAELRALATTDMATDCVEQLLRAVPEVEGWEVGEAIAECVLQGECGRLIRWPWNTVRDRRTPRASLPGADLVGFLGDGEGALLLFGEVKTSSDEDSPPNVMYGGSGMTWQLEQNATSHEIQRSLLQWLQARCKEEPYRTLFKQAVGRFLRSAGKEFLVVGVLCRDKPPNEKDLQSRAIALSRILGAPTRVELFAWYFPVPIDSWPTLLQEEAV